MQPSGAQWGISKFFVSIHSDAHYVFFSNLFPVQITQLLNKSEQVWTSLNKSEQVWTREKGHHHNYVASITMHAVFWCTVFFLLQTTTDADPSLYFFPNLFTCKYLKYISTISVREGAQWEISKFFFQTSELSGVSIDQKNLEEY